jgi:hypothetical protein
MSWIDGSTHHQDIISVLAHELLSFIGNASKKQQRSSSKLTKINSAEVNHAEEINKKVSIDVISIIESIFRAIETVKTRFSS